MKAWDEVDPGLARLAEATYTPPAKPLTPKEREAIARQYEEAQARK